MHLFITLLLGIILSFNSFAKELNQGVDFLKRIETPIDGSLIDKNGKLRLGDYTLPFSNLNIRKKFISHPLRQKTWHYFSFTSDKQIIGLAIVDTEYISNAFLYVYDVDTKKYIGFEATSPLGIKSKLADNSISGTSEYLSKNLSIRIKNFYSQGMYQVVFKAKDKKNKFSGAFNVYKNSEDLVTSKEVLEERIVYTHQNSMMKPEGRVELNGVTSVFDPNRDYAGMDYTKGLHKYHTTWNWASAAGVSAQGDTVAINFAKALEKTATQEVYIWINNKIHRLDNIKFEYQTLESKWHITNIDNTIDLWFTPQGKRVGNLNVLNIIVSKFYQPFGTFEGSITIDKNRYDIKDMLGVTEEHNSKW